MDSIYSLRCVQHFWFPGRDVEQLAQSSLVRVFCFVHAGGNPTVFRPWMQRMPRGVALCPIVYPGRGKRSSEKPLTDVCELAKSLVDDLSPFIGDLPFVFFGHSLGTRVALEVAKELEKRDLPTPAHLYLSGAKAPHLQYDKLEDKPWQYKHDEFVELLRDYGGTPPEVLENDELMAHLMPTLRADFQMGGEYVVEVPSSSQDFDGEENEVKQPENEPGIEIPATLFGGSGDVLVSKEDLLAWRQHFSSSVRVSQRFFSGGHFYLFQRREFVRYFTGEMKRLLARFRIRRTRSDPALSRC